MNEYEVAKSLLESEDLEFEIREREIWTYYRGAALWQQITKDDFYFAVKRAADKYIYSLGKGVNPVFLHRVGHEVFCLLPRSNRPFDAESDLIPLSGRRVLNIKSREISERTQGHRFTYSLDVQYNPEADSTEILKFLHEVLQNGEPFKKIALGCLQNTLPKMRVYFWGVGSNGMDTLLQLFKGVLGPYVTVLRPGNERGRVPLDERTRLILDERKDPPQLNIFQVVRVTGIMHPHAGIEFKSRFVRDPKEGEFKADPYIIESLLSENNKSAFLNWILS